MPYKQKKLAIIISVLCLAGPAALVYGQENTDNMGKVAAGEEAEQQDNALALPSISIRGRYLTQDEVGHNNAYQENVTSVYQGREELQRFQVTNPGDVFKGMNGVYSMDTRSSQAITPNIRGITGEGRTPLTIDGTEQSTNVWLHAFGAGNRSYVDPALFRSIEVEKGPSLSRGIKSGVGGAVNIRTIEPGDIIPEGDSWGVEANLRASSNTSKPRNEAGSIYGQHWRDIPGASLMSDGIGVSVPLSAGRSRNSGNFNLEDHAEMLSFAAKNDIADILVARSERISGNYYSGKNNADRYEGGDAYDQTSTRRHIPNLTRLYAAGSEVYNSSSETETTLIKNNWYLPSEQKIGLQFMRTDTTFGETTPGASYLAWAYMEAAYKRDPNTDSSAGWVYDVPLSEQRLDSYKLSYDIKPADSNWLNLETSLWRTKLEGTRYQTGATPYALDVDDATAAGLSLWAQMVAYGLWSADSEPHDFFGNPIDYDGTVVTTGRQWTNHDRTGFDFSNLMHLSDRLSLTLGGSYQEEKLDERVQRTAQAPVAFAPTGTDLNIQTDLVGPRSGERKEYSAMMNLAWQPTDRLTLTAGTRYMHYKGKDTGLAKLRRQQVEFYEATSRQTGVELSYYTAMMPEELDLLNSLPFDERMKWLAGRASVQDQVGRYGPAGAWYFRNTVVVPLKNGKMDASKNPFANGELDVNKVIENPYGDGYVNTAIPLNFSGIEKYERLGDNQGWEMPDDQSGDAFSPVFSATARILPFGTAFLRYAQTTRFPSINELTTSSIIDGAGTLGNIAVNGASKPERSVNWELGYTHDLRQFLPEMYLADVRLSYYNTEIEDFIDRSFYYDIIQFDKKKSSGVELQSRFDSGRYFGGFSATYRLDQKLCDKGYASSMDPYYNRIPTCMTGGFPGTYSGSALQPEYSIDMLLGTRLLNDKLELGWRGVYHKGAENDQLDRLLSSESGPANFQSNDVWYRGGTGLTNFYWRSVLLHDIYASYGLNKQMGLSLGITNLTDEYYIDPMSKNLLPGPGRTVTAGIKIDF